MHKVKDIYVEELNGESVLLEDAIISRATVIGATMKSSREQYKGF